MGTGYMPTRDELLAAWMQNLSGLVTAAPTDYGLTAADATLLSTGVSGFLAGLTAATDPSTKTKVTVAAKNALKTQLKLLVRSYVLRIQGTPSVTAAMKTALGITVADRDPTPIPAPATRPVNTKGGEEGRAVLVQMFDETTPSRKARPAGSIGAEVYCHVGTIGSTPPADLEQWRYEGLATKWRFLVNLHEADAGKQVTIVTRWINGRGMAGPVSQPLTVPVPGAIIAMAA